MNDYETGSACGGMYLMSTPEARIADAHVGAGVEISRHDRPVSLLWPASALLYGCWDADHEPVDVGRVEADHTLSAAVGDEVSVADSASESPGAQASPLGCLSQ